MIKNNIRRTPLKSESKKYSAVTGLFYIHETIYIHKNIMNTMIVNVMLNSLLFSLFPAPKIDRARCAK